MERTTPKKNCAGLRLRCLPSDDYLKIIDDILTNDQRFFPFEYYKIKLQTFSGEVYSNYTKFLHHILIDHSDLSAGLS